MTVSKRFYLYSAFMTICILAGIIFTEGSPLEMKISFWHYVCSGCIKALMLFGCFALVLSWLNNLFLILYFKRRRYSFITIYIFPFVLQKERGRWRLKIGVSINALLQWYTNISYQEIKDEDACYKYVWEWQGFIQKLIWLHRIILIGCIITVLYSIPFGIFLCGSWFAMHNLYCIPGSDTTVDGLLVRGRTGKNINGLFFNVDLEDFDKSAIYTVLQKQYEKKEVLSLDEKTFLNQLLIDSIYDERDYLSIELQDYLEENYLVCNGNQFKSVALVNARTIFLYYLYLIQVKKVDRAVRNLLTANLEVLEETYICSTYSWKLFSMSRKKEWYNPKYIFDYYFRKVNYVYEMMKEG